MLLRESDKFLKLPVDSGRTDMGWVVDAVARETLLFAAAGLLIGGIDDLAIDLLFLIRAWWRRGTRQPSLSDLPAAAGVRLAVLVPAWDEAAVIGTMLAAATARYAYSDYRIYVGLYPNDPATIDAAAAVAERDDRVRLVIGGQPGPTTKAACLNVLWRALERDDRRDGSATAAVILHDAEDVVHRDELAVFAALLRTHHVVQLPVLPLVKPRARLVSGHYADEFAEQHAKAMVVRAALGASIPLAGVGCAIAMPLMRAVAAARGGEPFDAASLTEDYELGIRLGELGARGIFARVADDRGRLIATRAYFPGALTAAVRQKARWMTGIALAGWDRVGWARPFELADHWMRARDRRAPLAVVVLAAAYVALVAWGASLALHGLAGTPVPQDGPPGWLLIANAGLLAWRLAMRVGFTGHAYGAREALWAIPRFVVGNYIALLAAPRALSRYLLMLRGAPPRWDKTPHDFPDLASPDLA